MPSTQPSRPTLSVVLCTYNRAELLRRTLDSLCRQSLDKALFEVVVIDDGSKDDTRQVAQVYESLLPLRYSHQRNAGLGSARNHGVFLSQGEILLFLDDDDIADPHLLEEHLDTHRCFPDDRYGVLGYTGLEPAIADDPLMHFVTRVGCFLFSYPNLTNGDVLDFSYFWGGRSSCKRAFLLDHGVFNPVFRFGCEDIELGFRLSRHGFKVVYNPRAMSYMVRKFAFDEFCRRLNRQGQSNYVFSRLHSDPVVQQWTEVIGAMEAWAKIGRTYDVVIRSGRELDRIARLRAGCGMPMDETDTMLLHQGYWAAFRASKIKGIVEKADTMVQVGACRTDEILSSVSSRMNPQVDQNLLKKVATNEVDRAGTKGEVRRNVCYDHLTNEIMRRSLRRDSICADVGCHAGEILRMMMEYAPEGTFYAFEPLPDFCERLRSAFADARVRLFNIALSDRKGYSTFNYVISNPGYSGFVPRRYDRPREEEMHVTVKTDLLDNIVDPADVVDFIKIDVEGAELKVLRGGIETIKRSKPVIVFEHGLGAADCYGTRPEEVYALLCGECGLRLSLLDSWLEGRQALSEDEFCEQFYRGLNYYFVAHPIDKGV
jgi:FkbM family methyltransferase